MKTLFEDRLINSGLKAKPTLLKVISRCQFEICKIYLNREKYQTQAEEHILRRVFDDNWRIIFVSSTYVFMENWQKLSFNYHQIPFLSVPLLYLIKAPESLHPIDLDQSVCCSFVNHTISIGTCSTLVLKAQSCFRNPNRVGKNQSEQTCKQYIHLQ